MPRLRVRVAVVAATLAFVWLAPASGAQLPPETAAIVFTSTRDGDSDVYGTNADGTALTNITRTRVHETELVSTR